jgi:hypothetical protein
MARQPMMPVCILEVKLLERDGQRGRGRLLELNRLRKLLGHGGLEHSKLLELLVWGLAILAICILDGLHC